ncbi:hypothetical protein [Mucisphaera sp.]|uniref:hypothetical protein n=1 Tax=Mucisphaera sp. TaxID=2913024 RepID=UPI003D132377
MLEVTQHYMWILEHGIIRARAALESGNHAWALAEIEMLHNIPGIVGRAGIHLQIHKYFLEVKYSEFLETVSQIDDELLHSEGFKFDSHIKSIIYQVYFDNEDECSAMIKKLVREPDDE